MDKLTLGAILLLIGIGVLIESIFADGIGIGNRTNFGQIQIIGTILGALFLGGGLFILIKRNK